MAAFLELEQYIMYLRKSRMDTDFEEVSMEETLSRHKKILNDFCKARKLNVVEVLEEVVSGESLSARPKMQRLLELVRTGLYAGVICIDLERLSRGSSMETGYIMQILQTNNCKIITPGKTYDLQNDSDEQFTDMKFMFSRYELKSINTRLVRGRNHSASEGKFMGSVAPYGYRIYKLQGMKGNSLCIEPEEAKIVRMIYDMYGEQGIGYNTIAYQLNQLNIPALNGKWGQTSVVNILNNEVYLGKIRWRREPVKRVIEDGMLTKKRYTNDNYDLYDGMHEPIITQEMWDKVKEKQKSKGHHSTHATKELKNPFATILVCENRGAVMKRNVPAKNQRTSAWYRCPTRGCGCKQMKCIDVENAIVEGMREWLAAYKIQIESGKPVNTDQTDTALDAVIGQLDQLRAQQNNLCEYLEKGIYTVEMFTRRNAAIQKDIQKLEETKAELMEKQTELEEINRTALEIIPTTQSILDNYDILNPAQKNALWKLVLKKATMYRGETKGELRVKLYPNLPR